MACAIAKVFKLVTAVALVVLVPLLLEPCFCVCVARCNFKLYYYYYP